MKGPLLVHNVIVRGFNIGIRVAQCGQATAIGGIAGQQFTPAAAYLSKQG